MTQEKRVYTVETDCVPVIPAAVGSLYDEHTLMHKHAEAPLVGVTKGTLKLMTGTTSKAYGVIQEKSKRHVASSKQKKILLLYTR